MKQIKNFFFIIFSLIILVGCSDKFDINQFSKYSKDVNIVGDTVYIKTGEPWGGFNNPQAILMGREPFLYVCDTDNNRIVMLDITGKVHGYLPIKRPVAIAQDHKLNLFICAEFDTANVTYSAAYKIDLFSAGHQIENAPITRILPIRDVDYNTQRRYTAITVFYDNSFFIARTGPNNTSVSNPDNSIFKIAPKKLAAGGDLLVPSDGDTLTIGRVPFIDPLSQGLISANGINCMSAFPQRNMDFIATLSGESSFKAQWFHFFSSGIEEKFMSQFDPRGGMEFLKPNRFLNPRGACLDPSGNIYIADAGKDSVFKFNSSGDELQSFGGSSVFSNPSAVAFFDKILYVLDSERNQILRFILSTDLR
ncbi:MAG: hypothetical protein A2W11_15095 [Ignavibacteria bacterium RBG_16_35_7]|nr:MAG: hypothetical protein A2W11_15095 [Ignavibacteria bacterium RBG_16_35_7]